MSWSVCWPMEFNFPALKFQGPMQTAQSVAISHSEFHTTQNGNALAIEHSAEQIGPTVQFSESMPPFSFPSDYAAKQQTQNAFIVLCDPKLLHGVCCCSFSLQCPPIVKFYDVSLDLPKNCTQPLEHFHQLRELSWLFFVFDFLPPWSPSVINPHSCSLATDQCCSGTKVMQKECP